MASVNGWFAAGLFVLGPAAPARAQEMRLDVNECEARRDNRMENTTITPDLDAGAVDAAGHRVPRTGRFVPWRDGHGGFVVWTLCGVWSLEELGVAPSRANGTPALGTARLSIGSSRPDTAG